MTKRKHIGKRLWDDLETAQGQSFVSDDMASWPERKVLAFVRANLANVRKVARVFAAIDREYCFEDEPEARHD
ncbi:MAG: hypothetical protein HOQ34_18410 [Gemmatimonadaceae bacterium]|nr:hypothetical protein [Gemmatimonadaceae bacterium]